MGKFKILFICILVVLFSDNSFAQKTKIPNKACQETIDSLKGNIERLNIKLVRLQNEMDSIKDSSLLIEQIAPQEKEKYSLEVDKFLNIEDSSIFNINFKSFDLSHMHLRNQLYYQLISNIHDLDSLIKSIDNMTMSQFESIKKGLGEAKGKIDLINSFVTEEKFKITDFLSEEQKQYYRSLVATYNKLHNQITQTD